MGIRSIESLQIFLNLPVDWYKVCCHVGISQMIYRVLSRVCVRCRRARIEFSVLEPASGMVKPELSVSAALQVFIRRPVNQCRLILVTSKLGTLNQLYENLSMPTPLGLYQMVIEKLHVYTVCPRSLDISYIITYYIRWAIFLGHAVE